MKVTGALIVHGSRRSRRRLAKKLERFKKRVKTIGIKTGTTIVVVRAVQVDTRTRNVRMLQLLRIDWARKLMMR